MQILLMQACVDLGLEVGNDPRTSLDIEIDFPLDPDRKARSRGALLHSQHVDTKTAEAIAHEMNKWGLQSSVSWHEFAAKECDWLNHSLRIVPFFLDGLDGHVCYARLESLAYRIAESLRQNLGPSARHQMMHEIPRKGRSAQ
jgi:hypothetical protein